MRTKLWRRCSVAMAAMAIGATTLGAVPAHAAGSGQIWITENASPDDAQDFSFTGCLGSGCSTFSLDDDADATLPKTAGATNLAEGTYTVTQAVPAAQWSLTSITCDTGETVDLVNRRVTIDLGASENVHCTFTNRTQSLTVIQDTVPDTAQDFGFTGCQGAGCGTFALDDDADPTLPRTVTGTALAPGTYTVTQAQTPGYDLTAISCSGGEPSSVATRTATVTLSAGEQITCTFTNPAIPTPLAGIAQVATGAAHTCAVLTNTEVRCWGIDDRYQLGNGGGRTNTPWPQIVRTASGAPLSGVAEVAPAWLSTCALLLNGEVRCWGSAYWGLLGNGQSAPNSSAYPVAVSNPAGTGPLSGVDQLSLSGTHACARVDDQAYCWGINTYGQLGNGAAVGGPHTERTRPVLVLDEQGTGPLTGIVDIETGDTGGDQGQTCARLANGEARCWGRNLNGQLGDGTTTDSSLPVVVRNAAGTGPMIDVQELALGGFHTCARFTSGHVGCWGYGQQGQLGRGPAGNVEPPAAVLNSDGTAPLTGVTALSASTYSTCALLPSGNVQCWGAGPLGDGTNDQHTLPVAVLNTAGSAPLPNVVAIDARNNQRCVRLSFGQARCWGANGVGQLGDPGNSSTSSLLPVSVKTTR